MEADDIYAVVTKLVGKINPIAETTTDNARYENLKVMIDVTDRMVIDICRVATDYNTCPEYSRKRASDMATIYINGLIAELREHLE